jgi:phospholipid/cholesterol/gamma-HCH transport system substrate-binding protein
MIGKRTTINVFVFMALATLLVFLGLTTLVLQPGGGRVLALDFVDAGGLAPRNDVTMRGVPVGAVTRVVLTPKGLARVGVQLQPGVTVPRGTHAQITRRSPIGDLTLELVPGTGPALPTGARIGTADTSSPPDAEKTVSELARVLHAVPSQDLAVVVSELATAVRGRGEDLASLSETSASLPERILEVRSQLEDLITTGPQVTGVFADNADTLADDLTQTADLADILRDRRYDLVKLSKNGAKFANVANNLLAGEKANIACMLADYGSVNATIAQPEHLRDLEGTLQLNHYFFDAVWMSVQPGNDGLDWFRVHLLLPQNQVGRAYDPIRRPPDIFEGNSCRSIYGKGVGPGTQPGPVYVAPGSHLHRGK